MAQAKRCACSPFHKLTETVLMWLSHAAFPRCRAFKKEVDNAVAQAKQRCCLLDRASRAFDISVWLSHVARLARAEHQEGGGQRAGQAVCLQSLLNSDIYLALYAGFLPQRIKKEVDDAVAQAKQSAIPPPEALWRNIYRDPVGSSVRGLDSTVKVAL